MTTAQKALKKKMLYIMERIDKPLSSMEEAALVESLENVKGDSMWGLAIQGAMKENRIHSLVEGLASQALDDPLTMNCVLGTSGLILLLRSTVKRPTRFKRWWHQVQLWLLRKF